MFTRGAVSAMSLFRGSESRMFLAPLRSLSALSNRASLLRPRFCVGSRSLSSQEATSGKTIFINFIPANSHALGVSLTPAG